MILSSTFGINSLECQFVNVMYLGIVFDLSITDMPGCASSISVAQTLACTWGTRRGSKGVWIQNGVEMSQRPWNMSISSQSIVSFEDDCTFLEILGFSLIFVAQGAAKVRIPWTEIELWNLLSSHCLGEIFKLKSWKYHGNCANPSLCVINLGFCVVWDWYLLRLLLVHRFNGGSTRGSCPWRHGLSKQGRVWNRCYSL